MYYTKNRTIRITTGIWNYVRMDMVRYKNLTILKIEITNIMSK
jgi:hypothetical protein